MFNAILIFLFVYNKIMEKTWNPYMKEVLIMNILTKHIILIGFMGTGKTTVGIELAKSLSINFFDTDQEIEKAEKKNISEIFKDSGEEYFRGLETEVLIKLTTDEKPSVIATGGGIILSDRNRSILNNFPTILLQATPEEIYARIKDNHDRPLLHNGKDLLSHITLLLKNRMDLYIEASKYIVKTGNKEIDLIIDEILKCIN